VRSLELQARPALERLAVALLLAVGLGGAAAAGPKAAEFSVLSYNTHGLPRWVAGDQPQRRFPRIAALVERYDVALLQEDFSHHRELRAATRQLLVERGNPSRFRGSPLCLLFCEGSGLSFVTRLPRDWLVDLASRAYDACAGWLRGANDCFATKGFQHAQLVLGGEFEVHVVNTHLDAGRSPADHAARRAQLGRLRAHLESKAAGAALVLGGDLNLDASDPADVALRDEFTAALGLEDTGAVAAAGARWRRLDYLYHRSGSAVLLELLEAGEAAEFVNGAGAPLSDHPAIFARLRARPIF
jgi:endonuclease/exonuclease/phosphatase family metal-dependent hydrolase